MCDVRIPLLLCQILLLFYVGDCVCVNLPFVAIWRYSSCVLCVSIIVLCYPVHSALNIAIINVCILCRGKFTRGDGGCNIRTYPILSKICQKNWLCWNALSSTSLEQRMFKHLCWKCTPAPFHICAPDFVHKIVMIWSLSKSWSTSCFTFSYFLFLLLSSILPCMHTRVVSVLRMGCLYGIITYGF